MEGTRVCSKHFISGKPSSLYDRTSPDWAPTLHMSHNNLKHPELAITRHARAKVRSQKRKDAEAATVLLDLSNQPIAKRPRIGQKCCVSQGNQEVDLDAASAANQENINDKGCQTDITGVDISNMEECLRAMTVENRDLKDRLESTEITEQSFEKDDAKIKFYTGLSNFTIMMAVFNMTAPHVSSSTRSAKTRFQEFVLVLMRLRLNLALQDLAYRFGVSRSTVSRIFEKWIDVMDARLSFLVSWPDRSELRKTMPRVFKDNFGAKVSVIVDCFEVFIERPSSLIARAITWSNYKHHNTVKFLIGITPQGVISFISQAWGGPVSDKRLTEECGILKNLLPGDVVLADRGFDISDSVGFYQASLKIPAFTRGKSQLSATDVEETRKIANVRIHVERVIGLVRRKYSILQGTLPVELIAVKDGQVESQIDKIARVCCSLTNLADPIVPKD